MRDILVNFFRDDTFGVRMGLYNPTHIAFLIIVFSVTAILAVKFSGRAEKTKSRILNIIITAVICLYFGDFFVHPLLNNENALIVDKLPFHLCTSAAILIAFARTFREKLKNVYYVPVVLGLVGALMYITVPTGVNGDYLFCYRSLQTLVYHSLLFMFGVLSIAFGDIKLSFGGFYRHTVMIAVQIVISLFANKIYSFGDVHYDWYFSTGSSFGIEPTLMPIVLFAILNAMCAAVYGIVYLMRYVKKESTVTAEIQA